MIRPGIAAAQLGILVACGALAWSQVAATPEFLVADYFATGSIADGGKVTIYPMQGRPTAIPIPFRLWAFGYCPDGMAIYGNGSPDPPPSRGRLYRVDLSPSRLEPIPGSEGVIPSSLAISRSGNEIIVSGERSDGSQQVCGLFRVQVSDGSIAKILDGPQDCSIEMSWRYLGLAPDEKHLVAVRNHDLEVIDLTTGGITQIGTGFLYSGWSPDGKWIAGTESAGRRATALFETTHFTRQRVLPTSWSKWSPDSRYLITNDERPHCEADHGTYELLDVENGSRTVVKSSVCQVHVAGNSGWVSSSLLR